MSEIRIVVADNFEILRQGLSRGLIETDPRFSVSQAGSGEELLAKCCAEPVDVVVMTLALKPSGLQTLRQIKRLSPNTKVLVHFDESARLNGLCALVEGAAGVLPTSATLSEYANAVSAVAAGYGLLPQEMIGELAEMRNKSGTAYGLTPREVDVAILSARLRSADAVSAALGISRRTVETHRSSIYRKTGLNGVSDFKALAEQLVPANSSASLDDQRPRATASRGSRPYIVQ